MLIKSSNLFYVRELIVIDNQFVYAEALCYLLFKLQTMKLIYLLWLKFMIFLIDQFYVWTN